MHRPGVGYDGQGGDETGRAVQVVQAPAAKGCRALGQAQQPGGFTRQERDFHPGERLGDAFACGLEPGLFAGPEAEEGIRLLVFRQGPEGGVFTGREEAGNEAADIGQRPDAFDIDPDRARTGHGKHGDVCGVGEIEMPPAAGPNAGQGGFALGPVGKLQGSRVSAQAASKHGAQLAASGNGAMPPALEAESGGALRLARGQQGRSLG